MPMWQPAWQQDRLPARSGPLKTASRKPRPPGITIRHQMSCALPAGTRCSCTPGYQVTISHGRGHRQCRTFPTLEKAKAFRVQAKAQKERARVRDHALTLREASEQYLAGARAGSIAGRGGTRYRPSVIRGYEQVLNLHVLPDLGGRRLADISPIDL
jgi:hypothetical protein